MLDHFQSTYTGIPLNFKLWTAQPKHIKRPTFAARVNWAADELLESVVDSLLYAVLQSTLLKGILLNRKESSAESIKQLQMTS